VKIDEMLNNARDAVTVKRVYGEPYEKEGVTVIPAASVLGSGGGGSGEDDKGQEGGGGGFHVQGRPVGAYVIRGTDVSWVPAIDVARLLGIAGCVAIAALIVVKKIVVMRTKASTVKGIARARAARRG
jgi:uncharacterized spore protein YtfJ